MSWCVQYTSEPLTSCAEYLKWGLWCSYERCISLRGKWFTKVQSSQIPKFQCLVQLNLARIYFYFNLCKWSFQAGSYLNPPVPVWRPSSLPHGLPWRRSMWQAKPHKATVPKSRGELPKSSICTSLLPIGHGPFSWGAAACCPTPR